MPNLETLLFEAMNSEIEAKKFYNDASNKAQSQAGKNQRSFCATVGYHRSVLGQVLDDLITDHS